MATSKGYGCYACICGIFLVILGFGLGLIVGYFVLKRPEDVEAAPQEQRLSAHEDLELLVEAINQTDYGDLEIEWRKLSGQDDVGLSYFIHRRFENSNLTSLELQRRNFVITLPDGDGQNELSITNDQGRTVFRTNFTNVELLYSGVLCPTAKVREETVFVNHAEGSDFRLLKQNRVELQYKIFVARCGRIHLDNMIKNAQEEGARGLLYYVDPKEPPLHEHACRSTSNMLLLKEGPQKAPFARILVHQVSYEDVEKMFKADPKGILARKVIHKWSDPIAVAPSTSSGYEKYKAELTIKSSPKEHEMLSVIGKISGQVEPDRYIVVAAHRNFIKNLAVPDAGTKTLLQLVDTFDSLKKQGWRPRRTVIFASFPARNYGNLGALKWLEENYEGLSEKTVIYVNLGTWQDSQDYQIEASPSATNSLFNAMHEAAKLIEKFTEHTEQFSNRSAIPSGYTDTTPFAYYAGIPVVDLNFAAFCGGDLKITENKTIIGNCAQIALSLILEFADSDLVPLNLKYLGAQLSNNCDTLFSFDSEYKIALRKHGINLGELRNAIRDFQETVRWFYESEQAKSYLLRRVVNDLVTKVLRKFRSTREIARPLFRNPIFVPSASNYLKVSAFQGLVNLLELLERDPSPANKGALSTHFSEVVGTLKEATKLLTSVYSFKMQ